jgi:hypothetical protein
MAHLHTYVERVDFHVALELCEIVIESATIDANPENVAQRCGYSISRRKKGVRHFHAMSRWRRLLLRSRYGGLSRF